MLYTMSYRLTGMSTDLDFSLLLIEIRVVARANNSLYSDQTKMAEESLSRLVSLVPNGF